MISKVLKGDSKFKVNHQTSYKISRMLMVQSSKRLRHMTGFKTIT